MQERLAVICDDKHKLHLYSYHLLPCNWCYKWGSHQILEKFKKLWVDFDIFARLKFENKLSLKGEYFKLSCSCNSEHSLKCDLPLAVWIEFTLRKAVDINTH